MKTLTFKFDSNQNPALALEDTSSVAVIHLGYAAAGWIQTLPGIGGDTAGMWDLAKGGSIEIQVSPTEVTAVSVRFYADNMLFANANPTAVLDGKAADSFADIDIYSPPGSSFGSRWITRRYIWNSTTISSKPITLSIASPTVMPFDTVIDSVVVQLLDTCENKTATILASVKTAVDTLNKVAADLSTLLT